MIDAPMCCLIWIALVDAIQVVMTVLVDMGTVKVRPSISVFRVVRLMRLTRVIRLLRTQGLEEWPPELDQQGLTRTQSHVCVINMLDVFVVLLYMHDMPLYRHCKASSLGPGNQATGCVPNSNLSNLVICVFFIEKNQNTFCHINGHPK